MINLVGDFSNLKARCENIYTPKNINEIGEIIKYHMEKIFKILHNRFPRAIVMSIKHLLLGANK